ncbi:putative transmembrane protein [Rhodovulum sp. PH10]|uniref:hypothetical protein n=1 Tax=Rhodovulum sp. PH10 TaxID=1187851 RepID=UPI00027C2EF8|nr:hypothetical protein [Rhodovulum sp. PH10]EJW09778.1 putative transmembrane protein [Rhodovulum sp. PH10]
MGEGCHSVDLLRFLAVAPIVATHLQPMATPTRDIATLTLGFANGSTGTVHYSALGTKAIPKERLEVVSDGRVLQLDNFRTLRG